jgi:cyanophycinase
MSTVMIARGAGQSAARFSAVRMSPGLGFIGDVIVDQHFRERDRFGRLLAAVLCNPSMLGFGLDENTAFVLDAAGGVSVCGSGTLTVVDGSGLEATNIDEVPEDSPSAFAGMRLHALSAGWGTTCAPCCHQQSPPARGRCQQRQLGCIGRLRAGTLALRCWPGRQLAELRRPR